MCPGVGLRMRVWRHLLGVLFNLQCGRHSARLVREWHCVALKPSQVRKGSVAMQVMSEPGLLWGILDIEHGGVPPARCAASTVKA